MFKFKLGNYSTFLIKGMFSTSVYSKQNARLRTEDLVCKIVVLQHFFVYLVYNFHNTYIMVFAHSVVSDNILMYLFIGANLQNIPCNTCCCIPVD